MKNLFLLICISLLISTTNGYGQKKRKQSNAITENIRLISADLQNVKGKLYTQFNECVGAGRANEGLACRLAIAVGLCQKGMWF